MSFLDDLQNIFGRKVKTEFRKKTQTIDQAAEEFAVARRVYMEKVNEENRKAQKLFSERDVRSSGISSPVGFSRPSAFSFSLLSIPALIIIFVIIIIVMTSGRGNSFYETPSLPTFNSSVFSSSAFFANNTVIVLVFSLIIALGYFVYNLRH